MSIHQDRLGRVSDTDGEAGKVHPKRKMAVRTQKQVFDIALFINEMGKRVNFFSKSASHFDLREE